LPVPLLPQSIFFRTAGMGTSIVDGDYADQFNHAKSGGVGRRQETIDPSCCPLDEQQGCLPSFFGFKR
jgi:hypothetical protein